MCLGQYIRVLGVLRSYLRYLGVQQYFNFWRRNATIVTRLVSNSGFGPKPPWFTRGSLVHRVPLRIRLLLWPSESLRSSLCCKDSYVSLFSPLLTVVDYILSTTTVVTIHSFCCNGFALTSQLRHSLSPLQVPSPPLPDSPRFPPRVPPVAPQTTQATVASRAPLSLRVFSTLTRRQATDRADAPLLVSHSNTRTLATSANAWSMALSNFSGVMNGYNWW